MILNKAFIMQKRIETKRNKLVSALTRKESSKQDIQHAQIELERELKQLEKIVQGLNTRSIIV